MVYIHVCVDTRKLWVGGLVTLAYVTEGDPKMEYMLVKYCKRVFAVLNWGCVRVHTVDLY